jgi:hypothetical protein
LIGSPFGWHDGGVVMAASALRPGGHAHDLVRVAGGFTGSWTGVGPVLDALFHL